MFNASGILEVAQKELAPTSFSINITIVISAYVI